MWNRQPLFGRKNHRIFAFSIRLRMWWASISMAVVFSPPLGTMMSALRLLGSTKPEGVRETVAGHCWRVSLMAWLLKEELPDVDMEKVIHMCLLHDLGEAVTGDIPAFEKKEQDRSVERKAVDGLLSMLPGKTGEEAKVLFAEMNALKTDEAKVYKALDKLEAVIAHNESDINTWLPLEYELQQTYAAESVKGFPILEEIQRLAVEKTLEKIAEEKAGRNPDDGRREE